MELIDKYHDVRMADRVYNQAWTRNQMILQQLNIIEADIQQYLQLAGAIVYPSPTWRASTNLLLSNRSGQSGLWAYGISGDLPIVLLRIGDRSHIDLARQLLKAHAYWHMMGLAADLVIWNEDRSGYRQLLQDEIMGLISTSTMTHKLDRLGGVFVLHADQISEEAGILVQAAARAIFTDDRGTFKEQLERKRRLLGLVPLLKPVLPVTCRELQGDRIFRPRSDLLQQSRRIYRGRARVRNPDRSWTGDPCPLVECNSKSSFRDSDFRMRRSVYLGRELPAVPPQPLV